MAGGSIFTVTSWVRSSLGVTLQKVIARGMKGRIRVMLKPVCLICLKEKQRCVLAKEKKRRRSESDYGSETCNQ